VASVVIAILVLWFGRESRYRAAVLAGVVLVLIAAIGLFLWATYSAHHPHH
jgi:ABC-type Mn2+/Zn2+ transport system permease subunit